MTKAWQETEIHILNPDTGAAELIHTAEANRMNVDIRRCRINRVRIKVLA